MIPMCNNFGYLNLYQAKAYCNLPEEVRSLFKFNGYTVKFR